MQIHRYGFSGPEMTCTSSLSGCELTDAGHMGAYGQSDLTFRRTKPATTVEDR